MYLGKEKVIHRNVTTKSFFVSALGDGEYAAKLGDLSFSKSNYQYTYTSSEVFAIKSAAPEILNQGEYSSKSDVYAFGGNLLLLGFLFPFIL
jgi:serine/threonine protein kinase